MGYTTNFSGSFKLSRKLTADEATILSKFSETRHGGSCNHFDGMPGFWCQWVPNKARNQLKWDGGEKFYNYTKWLTLLMEQFFKPRGIKVDGVVRYHGEDDDDCGNIEVIDTEVMPGGEGEGDTGWSSPYSSYASNPHYKFRPEELEANKGHADLWKKILGGGQYTSEELALATREV